MGDNIGNVSEGIGGLNLSEDGVATRKGEFPLLDLPDPALNKILNFLSTKEKNTLRLCSKTYDETIFNLCESTRKWYITIDEDNKKDQMAVLIAAKLKQSVKPRNLEISVNIECCKVLGTMKAAKHPKTVKLEDCFKMKKKILTSWRENITELNTEILGNEDFLKMMTFPKLKALQFRIYENHISSANLDLINCAIFFNSDTLKKLNLQNVSLRSYSFHPSLAKLKLTTLILDKWQMETIDAFLNSCHGTLRVLDINSCFSMRALDFDPFLALQGHFKVKLMKLKHLQIRYSLDEFKSIMTQVIPSKLVSLRLVDNDFDHFGFLDNMRFPKLKFFWFDCDVICQFLSGFELTSLEVLIAVNLKYQEPSWARTDRKDTFKGLKFLKLKELMVEGNDAWSLQLIRQNADTLERLTILRPQKGCQELIALDCDFPNMKWLAMRFSGEPVEALVRDMESKCAPSTIILTDGIQICEEVRKHAETYPYPMQDVVQDMEDIVKDRNKKDRSGRARSSGGSLENPKV
eukprot:TRINITY_DN6710_c0_g4_i1.p1 TRINITY_DN6710_c0_g4~~TRINITY_DN6710_c0_g4_i1.p1  ORF type:complete len:520 (+),score=114.77 TRINITY_DN6710_c0_g4_i1:45-1604(+)